MTTERQRGEPDPSDPQLLDTVMQRVFGAGLSLMDARGRLATQPAEAAAEIDRAN